MGAYKTPKRNCIIRARLTESEWNDFKERVAVSGLSQTEFIRDAIFHSRINIHITREVSLDQIAELTAEYGKIGSNLNQIARHLNQGGRLSNEILMEIHAACSDLMRLKQKILKLLTIEST